MMVVHYLMKFPLPEDEILAFVLDVVQPLMTSIRQELLKCVNSQKKWDQPLVRILVQFFLHIV